MPGYVIHLAIAEEYSRKHIIKERESFIEGVIAPDLEGNKQKSHYGNSSSKTNLFSFLSQNTLESDFQKGYFLHLITDYLFYNSYLSYISTDIYEDYDILNEDLIQRYHIVLPEKIKNIVKFKRGETKIINRKTICNFIEEVSNLDINLVEKEIKSEKSKWNRYRELTEKK